MSFSRSSGISVASGFRGVEIRFDDIPDEELRQILQLTVNTTQMLLVENDLYERYLERNDPQALKTVTQRLESTRGQQKIGVHFAPGTSPMTLSRSSLSLRERGSSSIGSGYSGGRHSLPPQISFRPRIALAQRMELAKEEIEYVKTKLFEFRQFVERKKVRLMAEMEEFEQRIRETDEMKANLMETVVTRGVDPTTGKIPAEKFIRFVEGWLKRTEVMVGKLKLKTSTTKMQIKKAKTQLKHRMELGEALHVIDFHELSIENEECVKKIDEKNRHLLQLKKIAGTYGLKLNTTKQKVGELMATFNTLRNEINERTQQIGKLQVERARAKEEVMKIKQQITNLINLINDYQAPDILDFVRLKVELQQLQRTYKQLLRRKDVQKITYRYRRNAVKKTPNNR